MEMRPLLYRNGNWEKAGIFEMMLTKAMDFGEEFGKRSCFPMFLEEMRIIPKDYPSIDETGFYVGGFNWFIDWFFMPIALPLLRFFPQLLLKPLGHIMLWGLQTFSKPPFGTILKLEAAGEKNGALSRKTLIVHHEDGYMLTAIPVVACLLQYLNGSINKPGLWYQANIVKPSMFFRDLKRLGVIVTTI